MCPEWMNCPAGESMKVNVALEDIPKDDFYAALQVKKSLENPCSNRPGRQGVYRDCTVIPHTVLHLQF